MQIGLIYYSYSGHTAQVMTQLEHQLNQAGQEVSKLALEPREPLQLSALSAALKTQPVIDKYDRLILGSPVHGGRMSAPMRTFLEKSETLEGKPVAFLLTHFFPRKWGAVQTIAAMEALCQEKGAQVLGHADVTWLSLGRRKQIHESIDELATLITIKIL